MDRIHLLGAEEVAQAGRNIVAAASEMSRAAVVMSESADRMERAQKDLDFSLIGHQRYLDSWLDNLRSVLEDLLPIAGEPIDVRVVNGEEADAAADQVAADHRVEATSDIPPPDVEFYQREEPID